MDTYKGWEVVPAAQYIGQPEQRDSEGNLVPSASEKIAYTLEVEGPVTYIQSPPTDIGNGPKVFRLAALKTGHVLKILMDPKVIARLVKMHEKENDARKT